MKNEEKIDIKKFSLTKTYTRELTIFCFCFYNWREITEIKVKTDELLNELGFFSITI